LSCEYCGDTHIDRDSQAGRVIALVDTIGELCDFLVREVKIDMDDLEQVEALKNLYFTHGFSHIASSAFIAQAEALLAKKDD